MQPRKTCKRAWIAAGRDYVVLKSVFVCLKCTVYKFRKSLKHGEKSAERGVCREKSKGQGNQNFISLKGVNPRERQEREEKKWKARWTRIFDTQMP